VLVANASGAIPGEGLLRAKAAAQRAIDLDETLGEAHVSLGNVIYAYDRNWPAAEREYKRAIELNASYATAHQLYGIGLSGAGRFDEAIAEERRAVELDPLSPIITNNLERILFYARRYDEAAAVCRKAIAVDQNFNWHHRVLGLALLAQGHNQEALTELRRAHDLAPEFTEALVDLASVYVRLGNQKAALKLLNELQQIATTRYVPPSQFAQMFAYSGQKDLAFQWLDKAVEEERSPQMMQLNVPEWDVLRDDPRFEAVVKRISPRQVE
jgi:tetratricopeptide (TPR) repeat protein